VYFLEYIEVSSNIFIMHPPKTQNSLNDAPQTATTSCIELPNSLIFVDCGIYPSLVRKFRNDMEKRFNKKTSHLFITHAHWDHVFAIEEFKDVIIISSEDSFSEMQKLIEVKHNKNAKECIEDFKLDPLDGEIVARLNLILPNITVNHKLSIRFEEIEVIFQVIGGHSKDSAYVYIPNYSLLCTGDNLIECYPQIPGSSEDALAIINHWEGLDCDKIIPGHGNVVNKEYINQLKKYYKDLITVLERLYRQKLSFKKVINNPSIPEYFGKQHLGWKKGCWLDSDWNKDLIKAWHREIIYRNRK